MTFLNSVGNFFRGVGRGVYNAAQAVGRGAQTVYNGVKSGLLKGLPVAEKINDFLKSGTGKTVRDIAGAIPVVGGALKSGYDIAQRGLERGIEIGRNVQGIQNKLGSAADDLRQRLMDPRK
jgi:hypothetical protein